MQLACSKSNIGERFNAQLLHSPDRNLRRGRGSEDMKRQVRKKWSWLKNKKCSLHLTLISKPTYCNPLPTIPYCYPELKAFVFSAAAPSIKLKRIVYSKWNKSPHSLTRAHRALHTCENKDTETHTPYYLNLREGKACILNTPSWLLYRSQSLFMHPSFYPSSFSLILYYRIQSANPKSSEKTPIRKCHFPSRGRVAYPKYLHFLSELYQPGLSDFGQSSDGWTQQTVILLFNVCCERWLRLGASAWFCFNWQLMNPDISWSKHLAKGKP